MLKKLNMLDTYAGLSRSVYILFVARAVTAFGSFVLPFLSLYLTIKLGYSKEVAGLYVTLTSISSIPGSLIGGKLSDRYSKKKVLMLSQALSGFSVLAVVFTEVAILKIFLIVLSSVFVAASYPAIDVLVAEFTSNEQRKSAYSLMYLGLNLGFSVGPSVAGFLFYKHTNFIFGIEAFTMLLSIILISYMVEEPSKPRHHCDVHELVNKNDENGSTLKILYKTPIVFAFAFISTFYTFSYSQFSFSLPLHLDYLFSDRGSYYFGLLMTVNGLSVLIFTPSITKFTNKFSPILNMVMAGVLYGIGFGMYYITVNFELCMIATVIWTIGEILYSTNFTVYVVSKSPPDFRGRFISVAIIVSRLGFFVGPVIMGGFMHSFGTRQIWPAIFIVMIVSTLAMSFLYKLEDKSRNSMVEDQAGIFYE